MLATTSDDKSAKVVDVKTGKAIHPGTTRDRDKIILIKFL